MNYCKEGVMITLILILYTPLAEAQLNKSDSLKLNRILRGNKEIEINRNELKNIRFDGHVINKPKLKPVDTKGEIKPDETMPEDAKKRPDLTMNPYKSETPYNWDPIYHCHLVLRKGEWVPQKRRYIIPADTINVDSISNEVRRERFNKEWHLMSNPMMGMSAVNGTIGGIDLMGIFERRFWQFRQNRIRRRTLEVLKAYPTAKPGVPLPKKIYAKKKSAK
jgi:hypothetical protein